MLCGNTSLGCVASPSRLSLRRTSTGSGRWWGACVRDMFARHVRQIINADGGEPVGQPICDTEYAEVEVVPVTVAEE